MPNTQARRNDDSAVLRFKKVAWSVLLIAVAYILGLAVGARAPQEIKTLLTSFAGGATAVVGLYAVFGKTLWENLSQLAATREQRAKELEVDLASEKAERVKAIAELKEEHSKQLATLTEQVKTLTEDNLRQSAMRNGLNEAMVDAQEKYKKSEEHRLECEHELASLRKELVLRTEELERCRSQGDLQVVLDLLKQTRSPPDPGQDK